MKCLFRIIPILIIVIFFTEFQSCSKILDPSKSGNLVMDTVVEDPYLPRINVNGTILHAETFGNSNDPMVVVIHGGPGADYRSLLNAKVLADDDFYVVFYDQRGAGLSKRHNSKIFNIQIYIDDLNAVIDFYKVNENQRINLLGHSWGAMVATAYVDQHPQKVDGLILIEPGGFDWDTTLEYIERSREMKLFSENVNDYLYIDQFITSDDHAILDYKSNLAMSISFSKDNGVGNDGFYPFWRNGAIASVATEGFAREHDFDLTQNLDQYSNKVLFIYSELNKAYGKKHAEFVSSPYPNIEIKEVKGTGHEVFYFGWENFYPILLTYLNEIN